MSRFTMLSPNVKIVDITDKIKIVSGKHFVKPPEDETALQSDPQIREMIEVVVEIEDKEAFLRIPVKWWRE